MNPFGAVWASFLSWYHNPSRILGQFDRIQRRLSAAYDHHERQYEDQLAAAAVLQARAEAHRLAGIRAQSVNDKLTRLLT